MTQTTTEPFVGTEEVAAFIGKPRSWLFNNGAAGPPRYKIGNQYRYLLSEVREWMQSQRTDVAA